jgi:hypothetical protein
VKFKTRRAFAAAGAAVVASAGALAIAAQPAQASSNSCWRHEVTTGGGLNGKNVIEACSTGYYVTTIKGWHQNNGDNAHTGKINIADNHNQQTTSGSITVTPNELRGITWTLNQNWQAGHRVCMTWISGGTPTAYACMKMHGGSTPGFISD